MIAKFTLSLLSTWLSILIWSQSISTKEFQYYYQVAADYHIHPPSLDYGYPWWYDADDLPVTGIIFLKKDLDVPLEKLNDTAWVAEANAANAREIYSSSSIKSSRPKFIIVPDSGLTYTIVQSFVDSLCWNYLYSEILFMDERGCYSCSIKEFPHNDPYYWYCGDSDVLMNFKINSQCKVLFNHVLTSIDSIEHNVFKYYYSNFHSEISREYFDYAKYNLEKIRQKKERFAFLLLGDTTDYFLRDELEKYKKLYLLCFKYGDLKTISGGDKIIFDIRNNKMKLPFYYKFLDEINHGLFEARSRISHEKFGITYRQLFLLRHFEKVRLVDIQMPNLICDVERFLNLPPPRPMVDESYDPIPEVSEKYNQLNLDPSPDPSKEFIFDSDSL